MFEGTVITTLLGGLNVASVLVSMVGAQYWMDLAIHPYLSTWHQFQRIPLNGLIWTDQSKVIIGTIVLYQCNITERMFGSRKFCRRVFTIWAIATGAIPLVLWASSSLGLQLAVPPGPAAAIGAVLAFYHTLVPPSYCFKLPGIGTLTNKAFTYFLATQLIYEPGDIIKLGLGWFTAKLLY